LFEPKTDERILIKIDRINQYGNGVSNYKDYIVEIPRSHPGESIKARIVRINSEKKIITAYIEEILSRQDRVDNCSIKNCLFCKTPDLSREKKIEIKKEIVKKFDIGFITYKKDFNFKNYVTLNSRFLDKLKLGFFDKNSYNLIDTTDCPLYTEELRMMIKKISDSLNSMDDDIKKSIDKVRFYYSDYEKTSMCVIDIYKKDMDSIKNNIDLDVTSLYVKTKRLSLIKGEKFIIDKLDNDIKFRIDPYNAIEENAYLQISLEVIDSILKNISPKKIMVIHGKNGLSTILSSRYAKIVYSVEKGLSLSRDILFNIKLNRTENVVLFNDTIENVGQKNKDIFEEIDTVILHSITEEDTKIIDFLANFGLKNIIVCTFLDEANKYIKKLEEHNFYLNKNLSFAIDKEPHNYFIDAILLFTKGKIKVKIKNEIIRIKK